MGIRSHDRRPRRPGLVVRAIRLIDEIIRLLVISMIVIVMIILAVVFPPLGILAGFLAILTNPRGGR
jgi:hypothetical protein